MKALARRCTADAGTYYDRAIEKGYVEGPRIFAAGKSIATTGGHADPTNGWAHRFRGDPGPKQGVINGADDARKAAQDLGGGRVHFRQCQVAGNGEGRGMGQW